MKIVFNTVRYLLVAAVVGVALLVVGTLLPIPGNLQIKIVKSGSMEPYIKTGGVVLIKPESTYSVGEVVTFGADTKTQVPTTHRIVAITGEGAQQMITTRGDANNAPDSAQTPMSEVHGKVIYTLPYVGYLLAFARQPEGFMLLVGVPAGLVILEEVWNIVQEVAALRRRKQHLSYATPNTNPTPIRAVSRRPIVD